MPDHAAAPHEAAPNLQSVARNLWDAATDSRPTVPPSRLLGSDVDAAYQVQDLLTLRSLWAGAAVCGHKVTSLDGLPCFGVLFEAMHHDGEGPVDGSGLVAPSIQAGVGFVVREDLTGQVVEQDAVRGVVSAAVPVLEIVDSRLHPGPGEHDRPQEAAQVDFVADNAGAARFVAGAQAPVPEVDLARHAQLLQDGRLVADGGGIVRPWRAFAWLTRSLKERGLPLRAGELVVVGGLTTALPLAGGDWSARVAGVGDVRTAVALDRTGAAWRWRHPHPSTRSCA